MEQKEFGSVDTNFRLVKIRKSREVEDGLRYK